mmetsp:Transcript_36866/g.73028  ORF Transcript_36866/g.73028 Transcript_36866/m.73028 type:complete len:227 (-) Transcript_36866:47-727(-)
MQCLGWAAAPSSTRRTATFLRCARAESGRRSVQKIKKTTTMVEEGFLGCPRFPWREFEPSRTRAPTILCATAPCIATRPCRGRTRPLSSNGRTKWRRRKAEAKRSEACATNTRLRTRRPSTVTCTGRLCGRSARRARKLTSPSNAGQCGPRPRRQWRRRRNGRQARRRPQLPRRLRLTKSMAKVRPKSGRPCRLHRRRRRRRRQQQRPRRLRLWNPQRRRISTCLL